MRTASRVSVPLAAILAMVLVQGAFAAAPAPVFDDAFWKAWGDGRAELAGYDLTTPRYGSLRHGTAVTIFVTETFSNTQRVKSDPGRHAKSDEFPVMKLNLVQDFPTGIYDYNLLTSAFVALAAVNGRPAGAPTKVSFSAQEWCGHIYAQLLFDAASVRRVSHSYFDGEADESRSLPAPANAVSEDALLIWARGLAYPLLAPGQSVDVPLLRSLRASRLLHQPEVVQRARLSRSVRPERVSVPADALDCDVATCAVEGGRTWTFWVEHAAPHRVAQWSCSDGERAQLLASDRLQYWKLNAEGMQSELAKLGLRARGPRMP